MSREPELFSIWFFIGSLILIYGILILAAGIRGAISPPAVPVVLARLHAGIWWGALLIVFGGVYAYLFRPTKRGH